MYELIKAYLWSDSEGWLMGPETEHIAYHRTYEGASETIKAHLEAERVATQKRIDQHSKDISDGLEALLDSQLTSSESQEILMIIDDLKAQKAKKEKALSLLATNQVDLADEDWNDNQEHIVPLFTIRELIVLD